ncbi:MAG: hypothetical protein JO360_03025 [Acidobacteria bacterium]|nr:hypothetical protein [Acidobacteriota bacterium]
MGFYPLYSWNNSVLGLPTTIFSFFSFASADLPVAVRRGDDLQPAPDNFQPFLRRATNGSCAGLNNISSSVGMPGDLPVVTPCVIQ